MKKKMLAAVLAGTMVMSLGTNLCWADGEKTKVTMTVWNGDWGLTAGSYNGVLQQQT